MDYIEVKIVPRPFSEEIADVLSAFLAPVGYDSFTQEEDCLKAYCPKDSFSEDLLQGVLGELPFPEVTCQYTFQPIETQDWNEMWERQQAFAPIEIDTRCVIHDPAVSVSGDFLYEVLISPKMSFGSGHHETTSQILAEILDIPLSGKRVLDMGCGTGVLGILAAKCGASFVKAIDIDDWVCGNARENVALNAVPQVEVECGDALLLTGAESYDLILANINRNILLADMAAYVASLAAGGELIMSGFYEEDVAAIRQRAEQLGLVYQYHRSCNNWAVARFARM